MVDTYLQAAPLPSGSRGTDRFERMYVVEYWLFVREGRSHLCLFPDPTACSGAYAYADAGARPIMGLAVKPARLGDIPGRN